MKNIPTKDVVAIGANDLGEVVLTLKNGETYFTDGSIQVKGKNYTTEIDQFRKGFYQRDDKGDYIKPM